MTFAERVKEAIRTAGVAVTDVVIGSESDKSTWLVTPSALQGAAQPTIDAFSLPTPAVLLDENAVATSRQKDVLATIAWAHKQFNQNWAAMTPAQKKNAVLASADDWKAMRVLVDTFV